MLLAWIPPGGTPMKRGVSRVVEPSAWAITRLEYDAASQIIRRVNPDGTVEKITYDVCGRVTGVEAGVRVASYEYDLCGRLIGVRDSSFGQRRFKYDAAGQIIQATDGLGFRTHFSYTATGQVCRVVDAAGQVTDYEYDAMDRLVRVIKAAGTMMSRCRSTPMMLRAVWCVLMMVYASIRTFMIMLAVAAWRIPVLMV